MRSRPTFSFPYGLAAFGFWAATMASSVGSRTAVAEGEAARPAFVRSVAVRSAPDDVATAAADDVGSSAASPPNVSAAPAKPLVDAADDLEALLNADIGDLGKIPVNRYGSSGVEVSGAARQIAADTVGANVIGGDEASARNTTDAGSLLGKSSSNPGVYIQQRSPILSDPRIRGYRFGQYLARADGAHWTPARLDVDSIISKVDSKIVQDIVVINGPYSSRYGPAFSFIDIATRGTPRYEDGPNWNGSTSINYNGNGMQWSGNQLFQWGDEDHGYSVFYSHMTGSDYLDGSGKRVPASYNSRNLNAAIGYDLFDDTKIEFRYLRQDQTDVELAGQFSDIDFLKTDGFALNWTTVDHQYFDVLTFDAWYNRTQAAGSSGRASKQQLFQSVFNSAPGARDGLTDFDVTSTGFSLGTTWGQQDDLRFTLGSDLRHVAQGMNEIQIRPATPVGGSSFKNGTDNVYTLIPDSESTNPGVFAELVAPVTDRLTLKTGARADWVSVSAGPGVISRRIQGVLVPASPTNARDVLGPDRDNSFTLWSAFLTGAYELNDVWTADVGFGLAQRPPTLTELYAMRPFESVLQQGLNRIQGNPFLRPERLKQLDVGLRLEDDGVRGGVRGFHAWVDDYITSQGYAVDPTSTGSARITSVFVNTPRATLWGGELFGEYDVDDSFTLFGTMMYVEGQNRSLNQELFTAASVPGSQQGQAVGRNAFYQGAGEEPLPQLPPLETRLGFRWHESVPQPGWGTEFSVRVVDAQDRVASRSLLEATTPGFTTFDVRGFYRPYDQLTFILGVLNLTDRHYREHLDNRAGNQLYQPGITAYFGTEITY